MKIKKILSAVISAAICCSFLPANVSADEFELPVSTDSYVSLMGETINVDNSVISALPDGCQLEGIETISATPNSISAYNNSNSGISTYANSNADFVMELAYIIDNPESMINGSLTTDTLVYWFWTYDGEYFTYDPAGYDIVDYEVFGIDKNDYKYLYINDELVGFMTQFSEAGPHEFAYGAMNSVGDVCFKSFSCTIEPADGSNRPEAYLQVAAGAFYDNTDIIFDWSNSYDADSSDYVVDTRIRVYDENYELLTAGSEYSLSKNNQNKRFTLNFPNAGIYRIYISVSDNHNNWSDWAGGSITIEKNTMQILTLADTEWSDSKSVRTKPTGSTSYVNHTLWSRLGGDICVIKGTGGTYSTYTNHNGTYYNVAYDIIAPGTVFMSAETWVSSSNPNSYKDPYFKDDTPRGITQEEIDILKAKGIVNYIVYDPTTLRVIDFYSVLNPLVASGWSVVTHTP